MMKKISLVFPVYNVADYVEESLLSALNQTYPNVEYIIVDDASTDDSMQKVRRLLSLYEDKHVLIVSHDKNKGIGAARNTGLSHATGDYIFFMDSDDLLPDLCLEDLEKVAEDTSCDAVVGSFEIVHEGKVLRQWINEDCLQREEIIYRYFKHKSWNCSCWNILYRLDSIKAKGLYFPEVSYSEDVCFLFRYYLNVEKIVLLPQITYKLVKRHGSLTRSPMTVGKINDMYVVYKEMLSYLLQTPYRYSTYKLYMVLVTYVNNYRLHLISLMLKDKTCGEMLKECISPILGWKEVISYPMSLYERLKHLVFLFPSCLKKRLFDEKYKGNNRF